MPQNIDQNILIVRTDRIGDVVLSLPLISILKKHFPSGKISFLLRDYTSDLLKNNDLIEDVIEIRTESKKIKIWENANLIRKKNFSSCLIVYPTFKIALILLLAGIKIRIGSGYRWYSFLFNKKIFEHRKHGDRHELEHNINMLKFFGINEKATHENVVFNIKYDDDARKKANDYLSEIGILNSRPIVIIHPGSGGSAVDWPIEKFKELMELIEKENSVNIILTGTSSELTICNQLKTNNSFIAAGKFSLGELCALIDKSHILIANSTGPIHIAAALNKNVIGFYPKIPECSPVRWGPFTNKSVIFTPEINCTNCNRKQCEELNCMNSITSSSVLVEINKMLDKLELRIGE